MNKSTPRVRIAEARLKLRERDDLSGQSARRFDEILERFQRFAANGHGIDSLSQVTPEIASQFIDAKSNAGKPSNATKHLRRSVLRLMFRAAHETWAFDEDPTHHIKLPPRSTLAHRALTDDELVLGRSFSNHTLTATRQPAAWALSEATATTGELAYITLDDLNLDHSNGPRVFIAASLKRNERWGYLSEWGAEQVERRAASLKQTRHLVYTGQGNEETKQISCCIAIKETLIRCGLAGEPDVRPNSLVAWAGQKIFNETKQIEVVAQRLGIRSLDAAAKFINYNWAE